MELLYTSEFQLSDIPPPLRSLYFQWLSLSGPDSLPALSDIDIRMLSEETHSIVLSEIIRSPDDAVEDFEVIFVGATLRRVSRESFAGALLSTLPGKGPGSEIWALYSRMASQRAPLLAALPYLGPSKDYQSTREILMPVCGTGRPDVPQYVLTDVVLTSEPLPDSL
ncbi:hypothetical protein ACN2XU_00365 [Primorskyibacter sp. 2E107]|uniref:hypothetical protein n=1 Tax=Primorskyibacter sp. 2E107 TaxID=3403458 RepID=UPI003AF6B17A